MSLEELVLTIYGDPVLRKRSEEVTTFGPVLQPLIDRMFEVMYEEEGVGLAAPQIGVQRRMFVYDVGEGPQTIINPVINESDGEWGYMEGCLSIPELSFEIVRPKQVFVTGRDLDGKEITLEADELLARLIQHELDHLDGVLLLDHLDDDERKQALKTLRERYADRELAVPGATGSRTSAVVGGLQLP